MRPLRWRGGSTHGKETIARRSWPWRLDNPPAPQGSRPATGAPVVPSFQPDRFGRTPTDTSLAKLGTALSVWRGPAELFPALHKSRFAENRLSPGVRSPKPTDSDGLLLSVRPQLRGTGPLFGR